MIEFMIKLAMYFLRLIEEYIISPDPPRPLHPSLRPIEFRSIEL